MAAQYKLFQRLIWLVDTIYSAGKITRDEIDRRWASSIYNDNKDLEYGERNFHRHKDALSTIVMAMKDSRQLRLTYQRFNHPEPHTFMVAPYCLKVFRQRWYLIAKPEDHPEEREARIQSLDPTATTEHQVEVIVYVKRKG